MRDVTLDEPVMRYVCSGVLSPFLTAVERARVVRVGRWFAWVRDKLYLVTGEHLREIPMLVERREVVHRAQAQSGFPGGNRLYGALKERYYWAGMAKDILLWCA